MSEWPFHSEWQFECSTFNLLFLVESLVTPFFGFCFPFSAEADVISVSILQQLSTNSTQLTRQKYTTLLWRFMFFSFVVFELREERTILLGSKLENKRKNPFNARQSSELYASAKCNRILNRMKNRFSPPQCWSYILCYSCKTLFREFFLIHMNTLFTRMKLKRCAKHVVCALYVYEKEPRWH